MDTLAIILLIAGMISFVVGAVLLIVLIIKAVRKDPLKRIGIATGSVFGVFALSIIGIIILVSVHAGMETIEQTTASNTNNPTPVESQQSNRDEEEVESADEEEIETDLISEDVEEVEEPVEDGPDPADLNNYQTDIDTRDIERNPDDFKDELIMFEGKIVQIMEDDVNTSYRIAVNGDYDRMVYVETLTSTLDERLLEDDHITVYGAFIELITYETVIGGSVTLPGFVAHGERIILNEE